MAKMREVNTHRWAQPDLLVDAGAIDVTTVTKACRMGWGDDPVLDELNAKNWIKMMDSTRAQLTTVLGIDDTEFANVFQRASEELTDKNGPYRPYGNLYSHYGWKPLA